MARGKPLSAAHKAKIAAGMRSYHRKCRGGGAPTRLVKAVPAPKSNRSAREALKRGGAAPPMVGRKKSVVRGRVSQSNIVTTKRRR